MAQLWHENGGNMALERHLLDANLSANWHYTRFVEVGDVLQFNVVIDYKRKEENGIIVLFQYSDDMLKWYDESLYSYTMNIEDIDKPGKLEIELSGRHCITMSVMAKLFRVKYCAIRVSIHAKAKQWSLDAIEGADFGTLSFTVIKQT